jgi:hypothetical protein
MCWRRDSLSEAQRMDPRYAITQTTLLCDEHQAFLDDAMTWLERVLSSLVLTDWQRWCLRASLRNLPDQLDGVPFAPRAPINESQ